MCGQLQGDGSKSPGLETSQENPLEEFRKEWQQIYSFPLFRFFPELFKKLSRTPDGSSVRTGAAFWLLLGLGGGAMANILTQFFPAIYSVLFAGICFTFAALSSRRSPTERILCVILIWVLVPLAFRYLPIRPQPATREEVDAATRKIVASMPKAEEIANLVKLPPARTIHTEARSSPQISLIFKDSPLLTPQRRRTITDILSHFYLYLRRLGYQINKEFPPLGVSDTNVLSTGGWHPGSSLDQVVNFPRNSLDDADAIRRLYGLCVFGELFHTWDITQPDIRTKMIAPTLFSLYYASSFIDRNLNVPRWAGSRWMEILWDIRKTKGQEFTDQVMYYTYIRWDGASSNPRDFDHEFLGRFLAGVWIKDDQGRTIKVIEGIIARHQLKQE